MARRLSARRRRLHRQSRATGLPLMARLLILTGILGVLGVGAAAAATLQVYRTYANDLETMDEVLARQNQGPAKIYDRKGNLLHIFEDPHEGLRDPVPLDRISQNVIDATIATEDQSFWTNEGINVRGLVRAGYENLVPGAEEELFKGSGGSSITQQLVKNVFIPFEERGRRSIDRKLKETVLALELTDRYSKEQILEWYLNSICYGNRACGIEAAAQRYFGVSAKDLTLAQAAMLAGIPQFPSRYDPYRNFTAAKERQIQVLDLLHDWDPEKYPREVIEAAKAEPLTFREDPAGNPFQEAQHFVEYVRDRLIAQFGEETFWTGGLRVTTTLDLDLQHLAESIIEEQVSTFETAQFCGCHNASLVAMDPKTGEVLVMVGARKPEALNAAKEDETRVWDIRTQNVVYTAPTRQQAEEYAAQDDANPETNFLRVWTPAPDWNNALDINHPGSSFKPVVYLAAFLYGKWNPATTIWDTPKRWIGPNGQPITPTNPNGRFLGPVPVREALGSSLNLPAWKAAEAAGIENLVNLAHRMGINNLDNPGGYGPSIATGGADLTLMDLTYAYSVLANYGTMAGVPTRPVGPGKRDLDPVVILEVTDPRGNILYRFNGPDTKEIVPPAYAWQITNILMDESARRLIGLGGGYLSLADRPAAAKTGTQQGLYDINVIMETWTLGYTPNLVSGVWVGNEDNTPLRNISSANTAAYIWRLFMNAAHRQLGIPPQDFTPPPDAVRATVRVAVPDGSCRNTTTRTEWFARDNQPPPNYDPLKPPPDPDVQSWISGKNCGKGEETPTPTPGTVTPTPTRTPAPPTPTPTPTPTPSPTATPTPTPPTPTPGP